MDSPATGVAQAAGVDATIPIVVAQKRADSVTILHISDLHFSANTRWKNADAQQRDAQWASLFDAVRRIDPDLIVVTGDLCDNAYHEAIRSLWERAVTWLSRIFGYADDPTSQLSVARANVRDFLVALCELASVCPASSLFVVPGNHDLRISGIGAPRDLGEARAAFHRVFGIYQQNRVIRFEYGQRLPFTVAIACLDSNGQDPLANLATGVVEGTQLAACRAFLSEPTVQRAYSIVLLHHHPLPLIRSQGRSTGMNESAMLLKNAGAVVQALAQGRANLALHGHKHWDGISQISSPDLGDHDLGIVAAGSVGKSDAGERYRFNAITLTRSHVARITCYEAAFESAYTPQPERTLGDYRLARQQRRARVLDASEESFSWRAHEIEHRLFLEENGDVRIRRRYMRLAPVSDGRFLPYEQRFTGSQPPSPRVLSDVTFRCEYVEAGGAEGRPGLLFTPAIPPAGFDLEVETKMSGAFAFSSEIRLAVDPKSEGREHWSYLHKDVLTDRLVRVLTFPRIFEGRRSLFTVLVRAYDYTAVRPDEAGLNSDPDLEDAEETAFCTSNLHRIDSRRWISVVDRPLPGHRYRIEWDLP